MVSSSENQPREKHPSAFVTALTVGIPAILTVAVPCLVVAIYSCRPEVSSSDPKTLWKSEVMAVWDGQLRSSEGLGLDEGASCTLIARIHNLIQIDEHGWTLDVDLSCGGQSLLSPSNDALDCVYTQSALMRENLYAYAMECKSRTEGDESPDVMFRMSSQDGEASLARGDDAPYVIIDMEEHSRPLRGPPLSEGWVQDPGFYDPVEIEGAVAEVQGREEFEAGDLCEVWIGPFWNKYSCFIEIDCGEHRLQKTSYNRCEAEDGMPVRAQDERVDDGDPKLDLDISNRQVRVYDDESETPWSVTVSLGDPVLRDVCPDGFEDRPNEDGVDFCLLRPIVLPDAEEIEAECDELKQGTIGFRWTPGTDSEGYTCPYDAERIEDEDGTAHCQWTLSEIPSREVFPTCDSLLSDGDLGYYLGE